MSAPLCHRPTVFIQIQSYLSWIKCRSKKPESFSHLIYICYLERVLLYPNYFPLPWRLQWVVDLYLSSIYKKITVQEQTSSCRDETNWGEADPLRSVTWCSWQRSAIGRTYSLTPAISFHIAFPSTSSKTSGKWYYQQQQQHQKRRGKGIFFPFSRLLTRPKTLGRKDHLGEQASDLIMCTYTSVSVFCLNVFGIKAKKTLGILTMNRLYYSFVWYQLFGAKKRLHILFSSILPQGVARVFCWGSCRVYDRFYTITRLYRLA